MMGATKFLKNYTQEACERALNKGFSVGVIGETPPETENIKTPHEVKEVVWDGELIGYNINKLYLPESNDWEKYLELITEKPGQRIPGYPFFVKFPRMYGGKRYQIILVTGIVVEATVDDSREFASEGLEWRTAEGNKYNQLVAAWKQIWQR